MVLDLGLMVYLLLLVVLFDAKYQIQVTGTKFSWYAYGTGTNSKYAVPLFHTKGTLLNTGTLKLRVLHTWVLYMY